MSQNMNIVQPKQDSNSKENQIQNSTKKIAAASGGGGGAAARPQEQQPSLKCPRCDSPNTKFCYYNNYSLNQPRHFCKTCRRYWTNGGALRNVPIGGGCRKNKKIKTAPGSSCSSSSTSGGGSSEIGGFKFFHGFSPVMDFNLGGGFSLPRLNPSPTGIFNQFSSFGDHNISTSAGFSCSSTVTRPPSCFGLDPSSNTSGSFMNYPLHNSSVGGIGTTSTGFDGAVRDHIGGQVGDQVGIDLGVGGGGSLTDVHQNHHHSSLASSIESLSTINQDLHWKLQQQRLSLLFGEENQLENKTNISSAPTEANVQQPERPQPILFRNLEISKPQDQVKLGATGGATEWFFGDSYGQLSTPTRNPHHNSNSNTHGENDHNNAATTGNTWSTTNVGQQRWTSGLSNYNALP